MKTLPVGLPAPGSARRTPRWVRVPAVVAPAVLIAGWIVAARLQRDPSRASWATISELAADYARHPEVMTSALAITGLSLIAVAVGLRSVTDSGRVTLGVAGAGVLIVALCPLPRFAGLHSLAAGVAFLALALWPALGARPGVAPKAAMPAAGRATAVGCVLFAVLYAAPNLLGGFGIVERLFSGLGTVWVAVVAFDSVRARPVVPPWR